MASSAQDQENFILTPRHVAAARALLEMTQAQLAEAAGVAEGTIKRFEARKGALRPTRLAAIRDALRRRGVEFYNGDAPGVRLRPGSLIPV